MPLINWRLLMKYTKFASHLGKFFKVYMQSDRNLSPRTVQSYSQTFSLFLKFMYKTRGIESHKMELNDFTRKTVEDFLRSLESINSLGDTIVCDELVKAIEGVTTNGKTKLQQG